MATVTLKNVSKSYGTTPVLRDINLDITDGEFVVLVGPSGCGKSTLLRMLCGLEDITAGDLLIDGERVNDLAPGQRGTAMVFQSYALYPHMNVYQNMAFGLKVASKRRDEIDRRVRDAARILQIDHLLERLPRELSGGQRQRVAIGRAIVREPRLFLFDEPLSNLDAALRVQTRLELAKLHKQLNATMVYVTHDQVEAMTLGDKIVVLHEGRIQQIGSPLELYHHPKNIFVAGFIGSPKMNLLRGTLSFIAPDHVRIQLAGEGEIRADVRAQTQEIGEEVTVGIRAEHFVNNNSLSERLTGKVILVEHHGKEDYIYLALKSGGEIVLSKSSDEAPVTDQITISTKSSSVHVFDKLGCSLERASKANRR